MQLQKCMPIVVIGLFLNPMATSQDLLTPAVTADLGAQCTSTAGYQSCVSALRFHGLGKDDDAMDVLLANASGAPARERYKVAQTKPKEGFWNLVARAGSTAPDCHATLSATLTTHFGLSPKALSDAADDAVKNNFLALSDLLAVPEAAPAGWTATVQVYRFCFSDPDHLFTAVKQKLGR